MHLWDVGLDFTVEPAVGNRTSCYRSRAQEAYWVLDHGVYMCPTLFNFYQNTAGLIRFGDLPHCSDISSCFQTNNYSLCKVSPSCRTPGSLHRALNLRRSSEIASLSVVSSGELLWPLKLNSRKSWRATSHRAILNALLLQSEDTPACGNVPPGYKTVPLTEWSSPA